MNTPEKATGGTALDLVRSSRADRVASWLLASGLIVTVLVLVLTPWQQTAEGQGKVIAYAPEERRQNIEAPIEGRVVRWYVREGSQVKKGDPIVDLSDNDPDIMTRLRAERDAIAQRVEAARTRATSIEDRMSSLEDSRKSAVSGAEQRVRMSTQRKAAAEQSVGLARATLSTAQLNLDRQKGLAEKGLTSTRSVELAELEATRASTEVERAKVALEAAKSEEAALTADRSKVGNDAYAGLNDARAAQAAAEAEVASASAELARIEVRLTRQSTQAVTAPRDGYVLRVVANGLAGEMVKAGDPLSVLVPDTTDRAVEIWISGKDMPLVQAGDRVRVQFEGWPALQFSGWPSIAVGTFGGTVSVMDAMDDGAGKFRVLAVPDQPEAWPAPRYLRQGVRIHAWVQLGRVSLGYEIWRQFNGFPPSLPAAPDDAKASEKKGGK